MQITLRDTLELPAVSGEGERERERRKREGS